MSELLFTNKSDLVAIADSIRAKAGINGGLSFPQGFVDGIDRISGSSGSDGIERVENGYNATFYDEEDVAFLSLSIRQGFAIKDPCYASSSWSLEDGTVITFPYYFSQVILDFIFVSFAIPILLYIFFSLSIESLLFCAVLFCFLFFSTS